jgi:type VII secretion protein EccE
MKLGFRLTPATVVWAAIFLVAGAALLNISQYAAAAFGLTALLSIMSFAGGTVYQWVVRRWKLREKIKPSWLVDAQGRGMVWDGKSAAMVIETFGDPWEVSLVHSDGTATTRPMPLDDIRAELRQYDITVNHVRLIEYGYKVSSDDRACASMLSVMGGVPHLLGGRVFLEVSVSLADNLNAIRSRDKEGTPEAGLTRTVSIATERVLRVFQTYNISAHILTPTEATLLQRDIQGGLGEAAQRNRWEYSGVPGDAEVGTAVSFVPTVWDSRIQNQWNEVLAHRQYNCLSLRPDGDTDRISYATTYLVDDPGTLHLLSSQGLRRENGRHLARIAALLPLSRDLPTDDDGGKSMARSEDPELYFPVHPLGVFLGLTPEREKVFMNVVRGGSPLWIIGDDEYARRFVFRLSTQRQRITVAIPDRTWYDMVTARQSPLMSFDQNPVDAIEDSDVIVCTREQATELEALGGVNGPALVVVTEYDPPLQPRAAIAWSESGDRVYVHVDNTSLSVLRERPPTERQWVTAPAHAR